MWWGWNNNAGYNDVLIADNALTHNREVIYNHFFKICVPNCLHRNLLMLHTHVLLVFTWYACTTCSCSDNRLWVCVCVCILPKWSSIPLLANTIWLHSFLPHCFPRCPGNKRYSRSLIIIMLLPDCRSCLWALSAEWRVKYESYNSYLNEWTSGWWIMCVCVCVCLCTLHSVPVCLCVCLYMYCNVYHIIS